MEERFAQAGPLGTQVAYFDCFTSHIHNALCSSDLDRLGCWDFHAFIMVCIDFFRSADCAFLGREPKTSVSKSRHRVLFPMETRNLFPNMQVYLLVQECHQHWRNLIKAAVHA